VPPPGGGLPATNDALGYRISGRHHTAGAPPVPRRGGGEGGGLLPCSDAYSFLLWLQRGGGRGVGSSAKSALCSLSPTNPLKTRGPQTQDPFEAFTQHLRSK